MYTHEHTHTCTNMCTRMYNTHSCTRTHTHTYVHPHTCTATHAHTHTHKHVHTLTHTCPFAPGSGPVLLLLQGTLGAEAEPHEARYKTLLLETTQQPMWAACAQPYIDPVLRWMPLAKSQAPQSYQLSVPAVTPCLLASHCQPVLTTLHFCSSP